MIDLERASRADLVALLNEQATVIAEQAAVIAELQRRVAELERRLGSSGGQGMPGLKASVARPPQPPKRPRRRRPEAYVRRRGTPSARVEHAVEQCPDCGTRLMGGSVKRRREVIEVPVVPAQVIEHVFLERRCPGCARTWVPQAATALAGVAFGQSRLGVHLTSLIVTLREVGRWPIAAIQWYLRAVHQVRLSTGALVAVLHRVAQRGAAHVAQIRDQIRASPVVNSDETGWREDGHNGYLWGFSTPEACYYLRRGRHKTVVDEVLGDTAEAVLVCDFYGAYDHYPGVKQRCWVHLLRDIHDLTRTYPDDRSLRCWARSVRRLYQFAKRWTSPDARARLRMQQRLEQSLLRRCQPFLAEPLAVQGRLCRRIDRSVKELFVFVADPRVPSDNNAAERSLRPQVVHRKLSGGTRSPHGTATKFTLATYFETAHRQGRSPLLACRDLLLSPQL